MAKILVVEENRGWQRCIKATLDEKGYQVTVAGGAAAGLLELIRERFDLLLVEGKFTYDLLHTASERCPDRIPPARVVMVPAGKTAIKKILQSELEEMNLAAEYLSMPCGMLSLREAVKKSLAALAERDAMLIKSN